MVAHKEGQQEKRKDQEARKRGKKKGRAKEKETQTGERLVFNFVHYK